MTFRSKSKAKTRRSWLGRKTQKRLWWAATLMALALSQYILLWSDSGLMLLLAVPLSPAPVMALTLTHDDRLTNRRRIESYMTPEEMAAVQKSYGRILKLVVALVALFFIVFALRVLLPRQEDLYRIVSAAYLVAVAVLLSFNLIEVARKNRVRNAVLKRIGLDFDY